MSAGPPRAAAGPTRAAAGPTRAATGAETIGFSFDGVRYAARPGDTLAAALLANGIGLVGRSFKYHRPRGIMTAGVEEPNALVTVGEGGRAEPNTRATDLFVHDGLVATSQNHWPSLAHDAGALIGLASRALPAGFYYKTFFGPAKRWLRYEAPIRRAAGLGKAPTARDPDLFAQRAAFCDLLVVGGGPAGLAAAAAAAAAGERVLLVEQDRLLGGSLLRDPDPAQDGDWIAAAAARIRAHGGRILTRTTAAGYWDHGFVTLAERLAEPGEPPPHGFAQRLWHVRAGRVLLATGLIERPIPFGGNDRPGVMLAQAVRLYIRRFGVLPGRRAVIATNNDDAYRTAEALAAAGAEIVAILDARPAGSAVAAAAAAAGLPVLHEARPMATAGRRHHLARVTALVGGRERRFAADLLAVSGGFVPVVHLHMQAGGKPAWDEAAQAFVAGASVQPCATIGAAAAPPLAPAIAPAGPAKTSFVDFQNDVTLADIDLAWQEGYRSVEHLKRYTTLGMATDQGKTGNIVALARLAERQGVAVPEAGVTTFRPPYTPVTMGALAGTAARTAAAATRRLPLHAAHEAYQPTWQPAGYWVRPRAYPRGGESLAAAALREAQAVRERIGLTDVSTLAKFEIAGPDAAALLELVCATAVATLAIGRGRYTFMLREDGLVCDDGTVWRLDADRYLLTSSTGGADRMAAHLSYVRNVLRPDLRVAAVNVQEHHAALALAGPQAAALVAALIGEAPPRHMSAMRAIVADAPVLVLAASYSGERAFELYAEATRVAPVWQALGAGVAAAGGCLYGLDAMDLLRIEKGHVLIGGEVDGRRTPHDLGLHPMLNKAGGYIGAAGLRRPALAAAGRLQLVGLEADTAIAEGAMLVAAPAGPSHGSRQSPPLGPTLGHVTGAGRRVTEPGAIALALLADGRSRHGETLVASSPTRGMATTVRVVPPVFYDPTGARYRG